MKFQKTSLAGVLLIEPRVFADARGFLMETWQAREFAQAGVTDTFVQDNHSHSSRWVLRGLHYQVERPQGKLVRVLTGEIFDVAVDLRRASPTFGRWLGERLSAENRRMLWIPSGFAHGFVTLSDECDVAYKCTEFYSPQHERTLAWNDAELAIDWPLPAGVQPIISSRDAAGLPLHRAETYA